MKILIIHRYFYPDTSTYAYLLYKLANNFTKYLSKVDVLTTQPSYHGSENMYAKANEKSGNLKIKRLSLFNEKNRRFSIRIINSLLFTCYVFFKLIIKGRQYNYVQVATTPPIMVALAVTLAGKISGFKTIYHCQDIYPEIIYFNSRPAGIKHMALSSLKKLDIFIMRNAYKIVVLSEDMKKLLVTERKIKKDKIKVINNFIFERTESDSKSLAIPLEVNTFLETNKNVFVFVGNLGRFQNLDILFDATTMVLNSCSAAFLVIGEGVSKPELQLKYKNKNIFFAGYLKNEIIQKIYPRCKIGFAPVIKDIDKVAYPSKIISYLVSGVPIITFSSRGSQIEELINTNNFGLNFEFTNVEDLQKLITQSIDTNFDRDQIKKKALVLFGEEQAYNSWEKVYDAR